MKAFLLAAGLLAALAPGAVPCAAQTAEENHRQTMIGFLPEADQNRVIDAYQKAVAHHADLKSEEAALRKERPKLMAATKVDRQAFMEKVRTHQQKLRQAMLTEDPTLGPLLDQIDKHRSEMRAKQEQALNGAAP
jgi:hypothetical protein